MSINDEKHLWKATQTIESKINKEYTATNNEIELELRAFFLKNSYMSDLTEVELRRFKHLLEDASTVATATNDKSFKQRILNLLKRKSVNYKMKVDMTIEYHISLLTKAIIDNIDDLLFYLVDASYDTGLKLLKSNKDRTMSNTAKNEILSAIPFGAKYSQFLMQRKDSWTNNTIAEAIRNYNRRDRLTKTLTRSKKLTKMQKYYTQLLIRQNASNIINSSLLQSMKDVKQEKYRIIAVIDGKTTAICKSMHLRVYNVSQGVVGSTMPPFYDPPHPCRTTIEPYFGDSIDE